MTNEHHRPAGTRATGGPHPAHACERCGDRMDERHCKIVCPNCGFVRDCSDP